MFRPIKELIPSLQRPRKRLTELMVKTALDDPTSKQKELWQSGDKEWHLNLLRSPLEILPSSSDPFAVGAIKLGINSTEDASPTGESEVVECGLVLKSIGYKSVQVRFDEKNDIFFHI